MVRSVIPAFALILSLAGCAESDTNSRTGAKKSPEKQAANSKEKNKEAKQTPEAHAKQIEATLPSTCPLQVKWALPLDNTNITQITLAPKELELDLVLALSDKYDLIAVEASTGLTKWWAKLGHAPISKPVCTKFAVYLIIDGEMLAIDISNGDVMWKQRLGFPPLGEFAVVENVQGKPTFFISSLARSIYALAIQEEVWPPANAVGVIKRKDIEIKEHEFRELWRFSTHGSPEGPLYQKDFFVYATDNKGYIYCIDTGKIHFGKAETAWVYVAKGPFLTGLVITNTFVSAACQDRSIYTIGRKEGGLSWRFESGSVMAAAPVFIPPPTTQSTVVCCESADGTIFMLTEGEGKELWRMPGGGHPIGFDDEPEKPDISRTSVILRRTDGGIVAAEMNSGKLLWTIDPGLFTVAAKATNLPGFWAFTKDGALCSIGRK